MNVTVNRGFLYPKKEQYMTIIDQNTGEVIPYDADLSLLTDNELIALSEHVLRVTIADIEQAMPLENTVAMHGNVKALNEVLASRLRGRDVRLEAANNVSEARLRLERDVGETIPRGQEEGWLLAAGGDGRNQYYRGSSGDTSTLSKYQISYDQSSQWQKAARIPDEVAEDYYATTKEGGGVISTLGLIRFARDAATHQAISQSENNEWYTPECYIEAARAVMGGIDLDPASCALANETIRAVEIYTIIDSGLDHDWDGRVWLNPPYGRSEKTSNQHLWSAYLIEQYEAGHTSQAVLLVNAVTDRSWFQAFWDYPICFVEKRIRFYNEETEAGQPTHGNVFVYFGDNVAGFYRHFKQFGRVVMPSRLYEEALLCETALIAI